MNRSAIQYSQTLRVQDKHFASLADLQSRSNQLSGIHHDREIQALRLRFFTNGSNVVFGRVDHQELNILAFPLCAHIAQLGNNRFSCSTAVGLRENNNCIPVAILAELMKIAVLIQQCKVTRSLRSSVTHETHLTRKH